MQNEVETKPVVYFFLAMVFLAMVLFDYVCMLFENKKTLKKVFQEHRYRKLVERSIKTSTRCIIISCVLVVLGCGVPTILTSIFDIDVEKLPMWLFRGMVAAGLPFLGAEIAEQNKARELLEAINEEIKEHEKEAEYWGEEESKWLITLSDGDYKGSSVRTWQDEILPRIDKASEINGRAPMV